MLDVLYEKVMNNNLIDYNEALQLIDAPLDKLIVYADNIRQKYCQNIFEQILQNIPLFQKMK